MKIKTKLTLGVGLLFLLIIVLGVVSTKYINDMKADTENILVANYNTVEYARNMLEALEEKSDTAMKKFELNLRKQEGNLSETGEKEATQALRNSFERYKSGFADTTLPSIRNELFVIMEMNLDAIQRKSNLAQQTAVNATFWIAITGTLCFLIAFVLLINLPSGIANPIAELTDSIKQIAKENYAERVHFEGHNEFGELAESFNTMAQKLEEYTSSTLAKLMMEKKRIEALINNMHDPVFGLDEHLNVLFANEEAIKIIGLKEKEIIGHNTQELAVRNDLIRSLIRDLVTPVNQQSGEKIKPVKIFANGKESYFEKETLHISIVPTGEQTKRLIGHVIILRNVTEYKELDFAKTNFIATVSHEFKTPISSIKMSLQLLQNEQIGKLNDEQKNLVDSIQDDANRLLKITGELLNMTQVESGNIQLSILPTDPKEMLDYAINANKTQAEQKEIKFEINIADKLPKVLADNEKTAWVLTNLISNAIRYSYDNSTVYVSILADTQRSNVCFQVKDSGQGIAPQYKEKIFDRYFRVPGTQKEGTGLGLAISKEFMEAQGGSIRVESEFGAGSLFTITLHSA